MSYEEFSTKLLAIGAINKGFNKALISNLDISPAAVDQVDNI